MYSSSSSRETLNNTQVFIISSNFKDIAIFKPKALRDKTQSYVNVCYYSETNKGLLRVTGNLWRFRTAIIKGRFRLFLGEDCYKTTKEELLIE